MSQKASLQPSRKWTDDDRKQLIALLLAGETVTHVAKVLERTEAAVRVRATKVRVSASDNLAQRDARNAHLRPRITK